MKKRIFKRSTAAVLAVAMIVVMIPAVALPAFAETYSGTCGNNLTWTLDTAKRELVISGTGNMKNYSISPWYRYASNIEKIVIKDGVTSIGNCAFLYLTSLKSITISNDVTSIGEAAFAETSSLTSVVFEDNSKLKSIGWGAFQYCQSLTSISIPDSVTYIDGGAFKECVGLVSVKLPNGLTTIESQLFYGCKKLKNITIPNGVTDIYNDAFKDCSSLKVINLPGTVSTICWGAFEGCKGITSITYCGTGREWTQIDLHENWFEKYSPSLLTTHDEIASECSVCNYVKPPRYIRGECGENLTWEIDTYYKRLVIKGSGSMYDFEYQQAPWYDYKDSFDSVEIEKGVTSIGDWAFDGCESLLTVIIPEGVESIGENAFSFCVNLVRADIPSSVTSIGREAFWACEHLEQINIPIGMTSIEYGTFLGCESLKSIAISIRIKSIGESAFFGCVGFEKIIYCGTEKEWNAITKGDYWNENVTADIQYHDYESVINNPTHTSNGLEMHTCLVCGFIELKEIDRDTSAHVFGDWTYFDGEQHFRECECGDVEFEAHLYAEGICLGCGNVEESDGSGRSILGDVDGDGDITNGDVLAIYKYIYNSALCPLDVTVGDVDKDGDVTNGDILAIYKYIYNPLLYPIE